MHLLVAAHDLYPDPGSGGTGRHVHETGRRLVDRGHRVTVVTRRRGDGPRRGTVAGMDVHRIDLAIAGETAPAILPRLPAAARAVRWAVRAAEPDLLSLQGPVTGQLVDALAPGDLPRSCTFHSPWATEYEIRTRDDPLAPWRRRANVRLRRTLEGRLLDRTDEILTLSRYMRRQLRERHGSGHDPTVVPGGVDAEQFHPAAGEEATDHPAPARLEAAETAVLTVRRLSPRMGHDRLLSAVADLADRDDGTHLFLAGDGPLRADLEALAADLGVADRVTFLGYVPDEVLPAVHASADLFVVPTTELEGFGLATLEALAAGTPVVATPVGGTVEILAACERRPGIPGPMLADAAGVEALRERLGWWIGLDPDRRDQAGEACRGYAVEGYRWERTVDELETRYGTLLDRGDGPAGGPGSGEEADGPAKPRRWQVQR